MDERRVPPNGLKMRCPKCGFAFVVKADGTTEATVAPAPPAKPPPLGARAPRAPTMVGLGLDQTDLPAARAELPAVPRRKPPLPSAALRKPPAPLAEPERGAGLDDPFGKISVPSMPAVQSPGQARLPPALGADDAAAPSRGSGRPVAPAPFGSIDLGLDLPTAVADLPAPAVRADLPAVPGTELPSVARAGLPARSLKETALGLGGTGLEVDLGAPPVPKTGRDSMELDLAGATAGTGFGELDLPSLSNELPSVGGMLPVVGGGVGLPVAAPALPTVSNQLPAVANALPAVPGDFGASDLLAQDVPGAVGTTADAPLGEAAGDVGRFGAGPELGAIPAPAGVGGPGPVERGEAKAAGGMAFGEVDLGPSDAGPTGDNAREASLAPRAAPAAGVALRGDVAVEASLPAGGRARPRPVGARKSSRAPRVVLLVLVVAIVAGGALQLTPYGAFGYLAISDSVKAKEYARAAADAGTQARRGLASDTYGDALATLDALSLQRQRAPRARGLGAYAVGTYFAFEVRFGHDTDRNGRANQWLADLKDTDARYVVFAQAAQAAASGDWPKARRGLENAAKRDPGDGIQQDIALLRGEVELGAREPGAANTAFKAALAVAPTARAHFGLARAAMMSQDVAAVRKEVAEVLAASPKHAGALLLRSDLAWNVDGDEKAALADLASVLGAKDSASPAERVRAFGKRGWIHAARGRAGEARIDFDAALELDPRSVSALVGQGDVFYGEGRYTEALSRFDTAVQTDSSDVLAIVSDAKAKLALERLQDAKTQLTLARVAYPKDWRVAHWLGKTEEALGNRAAAEHQYTSAIELAPITDRDAILPYVAVATTLLASGNAKEAQAKLDEARSKLPDSASLQRAFAELAAMQGAYDEAVRFFRAAIERDPQDVSTRFRLGSTFRRMGQVDKAVEQFDLVLAVDKDYPGLALERGLLFEQSGDVEKALEQFKNALAKAADDPDLQLRVGASYVAIGIADDAIPMLRKVLEKRANSAEANHYLGRALFLKGATSEVDAMRYLKRAVELDPHRAEYHLYLGWAANNASPAQLGLARDEIDKALAQDKLLADAYWQRGVLLRKEGAVEDALKDLRHALALKPSRFEVHAAIGECFEDKNDIAAALAEWQTAINGSDKIPYWRFRYGRLLLERRAYADAARHLVAAADAGAAQDTKPGWYTTSEFLAAEALRGSGRRPEAKERYKKFLAVAPMSSPDRRDAIRALRDLGEGREP